MLSAPDVLYRDWTVDLDAGEVCHHATGLVIRFVETGPGRWRGRTSNVKDVLKAMLLKQAQDQAIGRVKGLLQEGSEVYAQELGRQV